jgi:hypothetical protein
MADRVWCKTLQEENFEHDSEAGDQIVLLEPVWLDDDDQPVLRKDNEPKGEPSWKVGERVALYVGDSVGRFAAVVEIVSEPRRSTRNDAWHPDDWPWATDAKVLRMVVDDGPTLEQADVPAEMVGRRIRWRLKESQSKKVSDAFGF